jgi:hypothetical protein
MAAMSVLQSLPRTAKTVSSLLGMTLRDRDWSCEVDIAAVIADGPTSVLVAGEVKSWRDDIAAEDLENLQRVHGLARSELGLDCVVLAATLRDQLSLVERLALRQLCERLGRRGFDHHSLIFPALPLVFTGPDLSQPWFSVDAPWRWGNGHNAYLLAALAEESCKRNLGLIRWEPAGPGAPFQFTWAD